MTDPLFAGIDLGGTNLKGIAVDGEGRVEAEAHLPTEAHRGAEAVLERVADLVERLDSEAGRVSEAVGLGLPGWVDRDAGVSRFLPNLPGHWRDVPVVDLLRRRLDRPVYLLNDVRAATFGELHLGHGRDAESFAFFALGTGVGGGVVVDGRLRLGPVGSAGELGHQIVEPEGRLCGCGSRGCLETVASAPALTGEGVRLLLSGQAPVLHELCDGDPGRVDPETMGEAAERGDERVARAIERVAFWLGTVAANVVVTLHPPLIVIGGGMAGLGAPLLDALGERLRAAVQVFPADDVRVERSKLGERAGVLGAAMLAARDGEV